MGKSWALATRHPTNQDGLLLTPTVFFPRSYIEGIIRGYRNSLLTSAQYANMTQCETIDG